MRSSLKLAKSAKGWLNCYDRVTVHSWLGGEIRRKIYTERLISKSCICF